MFYLISEFVESRFHNERMAIWIIIDIHNIQNGTIQLDPLFSHIQNAQLIKFFVM